MKALDKGHEYLLQVVNELQNADSVKIQFMKRVDGKMIKAGITNEEVFAMMIDRMKHLNEKLACRENSIVITKLEECLMWLEARTKIRESQGVETTDKPHF